jgi:hypothetical protein
MKASYIVIHKCGKTCQNETEPEVNSKIRPLMPTHINGAKVKPDEKPDEGKDNPEFRGVSSGKIRPLLNIKTKF